MYVSALTASGVFLSTLYAAQIDDDHLYPLLWIKTLEQTRAGLEMDSAGLYSIPYYLVAGGVFSLFSSFLGKQDKRSLTPSFDISSGICPP